MLVYLRDGSAQTVARAATLRHVADPTFYLTQSQFTDTRPSSASTDPISPGAWQGSHWSANFEVTSMTQSRKILAQEESDPRSSALKMDALTTRPMRQSE